MLGQYGAEITPLGAIARSLAEAGDSSIGPFNDHSMSCPRSSSTLPFVAGLGISKSDLRLGFRSLNQLGNLVGR